MILQDFIKVSHLSVEDVLYTEADLLHSMDKIDVMNFHEVVHYKGIKFAAYNAGHVLGAAMFVIEIAGIRILYTGDYSRREDRHLMSAEMPDQSIDVLVVEATYGIQSVAHERSGRDRERDVLPDPLLTSACRVRRLCCPLSLCLFPAGRLVLRRSASWSGREARNGARTSKQTLLLLQWKPWSVPAAEPAHRRAPI